MVQFLPLVLLQTQLSFKHEHLCGFRWLSVAYSGMFSSNGDIAHHFLLAVIPKRPGRKDELATTGTLVKASGHWLKCTKSASLGLSSHLFWEFSLVIVDTIVNSTDICMNFSPALSKTIARKAGPQLRRECQAHVPLAFGSVVETAGYDSGFKQILHCNSFHWDGANDEKLVKIIKACMRKCAEANHTSIAFPAIGSGAKGFPTGIVAKSLVGAIRKFIEEYPDSRLTHVRMCVLEDDTCQWMYETVKKCLLTTIAGRVKVTIGDRTLVEVDTIVNSTGKHMSFSSALSKAIAQKAGPQLKRDCLGHIPLAFGSVVETAGYNSGFKQILHCNSCHWDGDDANDKELRKIILACLMKCGESGYTSIAFPTIGNGAKGFSKITVSQSVVEAIRTFNEEYPDSTLTYVQLCVLDDKANDSMMDWLQQEEGNVYFRLDMDDETVAQATILKSPVERQPLKGEISLEMFSKSGQEFLKDKMTADYGELQSTAQHNFELSENLLFDLKCSSWCGEKPGQEFDLLIEDHLAASTETEEGWPFHWEHPQDRYTEVEVAFGTAEYKSVVDNFNRTKDVNTDVTIKKVQRIQNPDMYRLYSVRRKAVAARLNKRPDEVEVTPLWHGTNEETVKRITERKFDRGFAGKGKLGMGVYFATDSSYSSINKYCRPNRDGMKHIIMARVIVGDFCLGFRGCKAVPDKLDMRPQPYDSVVDNMENPTMYAVFDDASAYPDYLIEFEILLTEAVSANVSLNATSSALEWLPLDLLSPTLLFL
ncbi:protein mono-ADP-ribosyltransferase PARP15-like [Watersipora subatra]|uniref:protein mono-ADP-ribosyltransferase PARP15-like n=1 Tax=Watersipora subatra TaxID=2589382 RepID=UPI00355B5E09